MEPRSGLEIYCCCVGLSVVTWSHAESMLYSANRAIYENDGATLGYKKIPRGLKANIEFLSTAANTSLMERGLKDNATHVSEFFRDLKDTRDQLVHGAPSYMTQGLIRSLRFRTIRGEAIDQVRMMQLVDVIGFGNQALALADVVADFAQKVIESYGQQSSDAGPDA